MFAGSSPITFTSPSSKAHQKSGPFAPPALPGLDAHTTLSELPPWSPPCATLRPLPSPMTGLPRLPEPPFRRAVPTTPADRAGARVDYFPARNAFPKWQEGQHPRCHFRGLRRLHSRYGPPDRSATQGDLCHEAPARPVTQPSRSSATGPIDNYPGGIPPPQVFRAFGAHCQFRTHAVQQDTFTGCVPHTAGAAGRQFCFSGEPKLVVALQPLLNSERARRNSSRLTTQFGSCPHLC